MLCKSQKPWSVSKKKQIISNKITVIDEQLMAYLVMAPATFNYYLKQLKQVDNQQ